MTKAISDVGKIAAANVVACRTFLSVVLTSLVLLVLGEHKNAVSTLLKMQSIHTCTEGSSVCRDT